jgi:hypothetical protein
VGRQLGQLGPLTGGGSSGGPDPLVGDGREPGRWGPRGTHVSQPPLPLHHILTYVHLNKTFSYATNTRLLVCQVLHSAKRGFAR